MEKNVTTFGPVKLRRKRNFGLVIRDERELNTILFCEANLRQVEIAQLRQRVTAKGKAMCLKESLSGFKNQQEKCQLTLTSNAAKAGSSMPTISHKIAPSGTSASNSIKCPAPAVKFSNNTERLQHINSIRKGPVGSQLKHVIDLLRETRRALTTEQINEACYVDMNADKVVLQSVMNNKKVKYDGKCFSYKPNYVLEGKKQLFDLLLEDPHGIPVVDLKDSYPMVMEDLQAFKADGQIWLLSNSCSRDDIAYPNEPDVSIKVDDDLKQLFRGIELPHDMIDIEKDLQKNGMKPATSIAKSAMTQVHDIPSKPKTRKKFEITKRTKLTNTHLPELFHNVNVPRF